MRNRVTARAVDTPRHRDLVMQHDDSDSVLDGTTELAASSYAPLADGLGGAGAIAVADPADAFEALDGTWAPPVQEIALDPELVAILCGEPVGGEDAPEGAASSDGDDVAPSESGSAEADSAEADSAEDGSADDDGAPAAEEEAEELVRAAAALLFASPEALSNARLADLLGGASKRAAKDALLVLSRRLEESGLPFVVRQVAGGWRIFTAPEMADVVARLDTSRKVERNSPAALETLAIGAYRQPVTKAEIEAIRGVQAGPILRTLTDRRLIRVQGRADQPGSPLLYGTTQEFLDRFGLASIDDLPRDGELARD
ncbi:MAG: SMC-Scp complex subunit ScpB [Planctomycetota bacterium]